MPTEAKPLFHPAALRDAMKSFILPAAATAARRTSTGAVEIARLSC